MTSSIWEWSVILIVVVVNIYLYGTCFYMFLNRRGVKSSRHRIPYVGDFYEVIQRKKNLIQAIDKVYKAYPGERYVGFYEIVGVIILLKDPELIRTVCVEAIDNFLDHRKIVPDDETSLYSKHLFSLKGQKWRDMRAVMDPAFNNTRIKEMFPSILKSTENLSMFLSQISTQAGDNIREVELKSLFTKYVNGVIASCVCGCDINSLNNPTHEIYSNGEMLSKANFLQFANIIAYSDKLFKALNLMNSDEKPCIFFRNLYLSKIKEREQSGKTSNDFLQYLINVKNGSVFRNILRKNSTDDIFTPNGSFKRDWTDDDFLGQALCFYIGGLNTVSNLLTFLFHELAVNTDIQTKLQNDFDKANLVNNQEKICDNILKMEYLDMVVSETLRKWPPIIATDRECVKPYTLPPANENAKIYTFLSKDPVWIPIYSIHHDPEHFPNPEAFNPERFSKENKNTIKPNTFIPFGVGPRNCIGSKFATSVIKITVFHILSKFKLVPISRTVAELPIDNDVLILKPKSDCWIGIKSRNSTI